MLDLFHISGLRRRVNEETCVDAILATDDVIGTTGQARSTVTSTHVPVFQQLSLLVDCVSAELIHKQAVLLFVLSKAMVKVASFQVVLEARQ